MFNNTSIWIFILMFSGISSQSITENQIDTDKDGYTDIQEKAAGTDPNDPGSFIYYGGWPFNPDKDKYPAKNLTDLKCPGDIGCECYNDDECYEGHCMIYPGNAYCMPNEGAQFPRFTLLDQYEEFVDIYDFTGQGKYIILELSTAWCGGCNTVADWMATNNMSITNKVWWKPEYVKIKEMVKNKEIYFINIQYEDRYRDNASIESIMDWFTKYPDEDIPVLVDLDKIIHSTFKPSGLPAMILLDENMQIVKYSVRGLNHAFDRLLNIQGLK